MSLWCHQGYFPQTPPEPKKTVHVCFQSAPHNEETDSHVQNQFSASSIVYLDHPSAEGIFHLRVYFTATFDTRNMFVFILKVPLSPILPGTVHEDAGKQNLNRWLVCVSLQGIILPGLFVEAGTLENLVLKYIWEFICFYLVLNSNTHTTSCSMPEIPGWSIKNKLNIWRL